MIPHWYLEEPVLAAALLWNDNCDEGKGPILYSH